MGKRRVRVALVYALLAVLVVVLVVANAGIGTVYAAPGDIVATIVGSAPSSETFDIIWNLRMPRVAMAALLGGALGVAGYLLQTFFNNPIAGPYVLGISHGAKLMVALAMIVFIGSYGEVSSWLLIGAAFVGALISTGFILLVARRIQNMAALLVAGVMIGYVCSAATEFLITFASDADIANLHGWSQGSFSGSSWANVQVAAIVCGLGIAAALVLSKPIGAYLMGESYARSVGVNVGRFRVVLILLASLLAATVTAFAGPISFVGIAVPFLAKRALGTAKPLAVIPATVLGGAAFCLLSDLIARMAFAPLEMSISTVTALFGAPVVIFMLVTMKTRRDR